MCCCSRATLGSNCAVGCCAREPTAASRTASRRLMYFRFIAQTSLDSQSACTNYILEHEQIRQIEQSGRGQAAKQRRDKTQTERAPAGSCPLKNSLSADVSQDN